jgi:hypothetical protein
MALDVGRLKPAAEVLLADIASQLQCSWTQDAGIETSPTPLKNTGTPSNSPHLPRAGGGRQRRLAQRRILPAGTEAHDPVAREASSTETLRDGAPSAPSTRTPPGGERELLKPHPSPPWPAGRGAAEHESFRRRTEEGAASPLRSGSRDGLTLGLFKGGATENRRGSRQHHAEATPQISSTCPPPPPDGARGPPPSGKAPDTRKKNSPRLQVVQRSRPPLSRSLQPAKPLEERERGAGESSATLNAGTGTRARKEGV